MASLQSGLSRFVIIKTAIYTLIFAIGITMWIIHKNNTGEEKWLTQKRSDPSIIVCMDTNEKNCFNLEIARTASQREYGLMNRTEMGLGSGMIFVFDRDDIYPFWMKNTLIPLDMIRISSTGQIIDIQTAKSCIQDPCPTYIPAGSSRYVIELNAGVAQLIHINTGSILYISDK